MEEEIKKPKREDFKVLEEPPAKAGKEGIAAERCTAAEAVAAVRQGNKGRDVREEDGEGAADTRSESLARIGRSDARGGAFGAAVHCPVTVISVKYTGSVMQGLGSLPEFDAGV